MPRSKSHRAALALLNNAVKARGSTQKVSRSVPETAGNENTPAEDAASRKRSRADDPEDKDEILGKSKRLALSSSHHHCYSPMISSTVDVLLEALAISGKHMARTVDLFAPWGVVLRDGLRQEVNLLGDETIEPYTAE
jgi:hypothetical protein